MNKSPFFSIIIPIYKVEKYLHKCVDSILTQDYDNFEIILVDDGSPDKCPEICDRYAKDDLRVKVIHKTNGGLSSARNVGIKAATGKYVIFVDSDDYWNSKQALSKLFKKLDIDKCIDVLDYNNIDFSCVTGKEVICNREYDVELMQNSDKEEVLRYLFKNGLFPGAAWVTVTRRQLLIEKDLYFIEGIKAEDIDWLIKVYLEANTYSALNEAFYVYLKYRNDSITGTADAKSIDDLLYTIKLWGDKLKSDKYQYISNEIMGLLGKHFVCALLIYNCIDKEQKKEYYLQLKKYKYMLDYCKEPLISVVKILHISIISGMLNIYRTIKTKW